MSSRKRLLAALAVGVGIVVAVYVALELVRMY